MLTWYRELIRLRRTNPCLNNGAPGNAIVTFNGHENWIRMQRGAIVVICNLGASERAFPVPPESKVLLSSRDMLENMGGQVDLPPDTLAVLTGAIAFLSSK